MVKVNDDLRTNIDNGRVSVLVTLDLSAAFGIINHDILMEGFERWWRLAYLGQHWTGSYPISKDVILVFVLKILAPKTIISCGVPQGSILGPLLFSLYLMPLCYHNYADDTQLYISLSADYLNPIDTLSECIKDIDNSMSSLGKG